MASLSATATSTAATTSSHHHPPPFYFDEKWKLSKKEGSSRSSRSSSCPLMKSSSQSRRRCSFSRKCAKLVKEQRARFYIVRRCVTMLICWNDYSDSWECLMDEENRGKTEKDLERERKGRRHNLFPLFVLDLFGVCLPQKTQFSFSLFFLRTWQEEIDLYLYINFCFVFLVYGLDFFWAVNLQTKEMGSWCYIHCDYLRIMRRISMKISQLELCGLILIHPHRHSLLLFFIFFAIMVLISSWFSGFTWILKWILKWWVWFKYFIQQKEVGDSIQLYCSWWNCGSGELGWHK